MENLDKLKKIKFISDKYYIEKILVNNICISLDKSNSIYIDSDSTIDIFCLPLYFKNHMILKIMLFNIENFLTGAGLSVKEITRELEGIHLFGSANQIQDCIFLDNVQNIPLKREKYVSRKSISKYCFFVLIPNILSIVFIICFFIWALATILF